MARNPAARKAAKGEKPKAVVAAKRTLEIAANTPSARIQQAAKMPVLRCLLSKGLLKAGIGVAVMVRGVSQEEQHIGSFMLDTYCPGGEERIFPRAEPAGRGIRAAGARSGRRHRAG